MYVVAVSGEEDVSDPCDNSNDSGLGFDYSLDLASRSVLKYTNSEVRMHYLLIVRKALKSIFLQTYNFCMK